MSPSHRRRKLAIDMAIALLVIPPCVLCSLPPLFWLGSAVEEYWNRIPFDSATWKENLVGETGNVNPIRLRMIDDLLPRHQLVGKSKAEIDELLGMPPEGGFFKGYDYVYWLGPERGFIRIDSEWLAIRFDDGQVIKADIVRD